MRVQCPYCQMNFKSNRQFSYHLKTIHNKTFVDFIKEQHLIPKCQCGKDVTYKKYKDKGVVFRKTCGNYKCWLKGQQSPERKEKNRKKRFDYLKSTNNETPWERKRNGKMSYLENWFFEKCIEYKLQEKYDIITEYPVYPHFIDYAFINIKLAVEMDGKQHFTRDKQQEKDKEKENNLLSQGWKIYRINYQQINDKEFENFLEYLNGFNSQPKIMKSEIIKYSRNEKKIICLNCGKEIISKRNEQKFCNQHCSSTYNSIHYNTRKVKDRPSKEELEKLTEQYTMVYIGKIFGVSDNAIRNWIKLYKKSQNH